MGMWLIFRRQFFILGPILISLATKADKTCDTPTLKSVRENEG